MAKKKTPGPMDLLLEGNLALRQRLDSVWIPLLKERRAQVVANIEDQALLAMSTPAGDGAGAES